MRDKKKEKKVFALLICVVIVKKNREGKRREVSNLISTMIIMYISFLDSIILLFAEQVF